jgi:hypothetical protein
MKKTKIHKKQSRNTKSKIYIQKHNKNKKTVKLFSGVQAKQHH